MLSQGQFDKAALRFERALAIQEQELRPEHPGRATTLRNWAQLLVKQARYF